MAGSPKIDTARNVAIIGLELDDLACKIVDDRRERNVKALNLKDATRVEANKVRMGS